LVRKSNGWIVAIAATAWILVVSAGMGVLLSYGFKQGATGVTPQRWPAASRIRPAPGLATLVMLAHPQCSCTRASLRELELLMANLNGRVTGQVLFYQPEHTPADWASSDLWEMASRIPGVSAAWDRGGAEARRFGGATSGHVVVYDARGRLIFSGGITSARGHSGDNAGRSTIVSALLHGVLERTSTPVFGCSLSDARQRFVQ
jgi:hypothetical protein